MQKESYVIVGVNNSGEIVRKRSFTKVKEKRRAKAWMVLVLVLCVIAHSGGS